jgi:hypothetical protein
LDIDLSNVDFPSLSKTVNIDICSPLKEKKDDLENSWAKLLVRVLNPPLNDNDRCNMECPRPQ